MTERAVKSAEKSAPAKKRRAVPDIARIHRSSYLDSRPGDVFLHRKASCSCGGGCSACQAKSNLNISQPNDPAEIEADQIADKVMRTPDGHTPPIERFESLSPGIHRKSSQCDDEGSIQRKAERSPKTATSAATSPQAGSPSSSGGKPLDRKTRTFFELRFGADFSHVRVHTDAQAAETARAVNALAFTAGRDVVFGEGQYQPDTSWGKRLLAHELTHVVQQERTGIDLKGIARLVRHQSSGILQRQPAARPTSEDVWGLRVTRSMCGCVQDLRDNIAWSNTAAATYTACDVAANTTGTLVEACFDAAHPGTTVSGSTSSSGTVTAPPLSADPCQRLEDKGTLVHETMHARHTDDIARAQGAAFFREWRRLAGTPDRLDKLRPAFPAEVAAHEAQFNNGHDWAQDEVNSYTWERRFYESAIAALNRICP